MADHQDRPEHRVLGRTQDELDGMRPLDHGLHHEPVDARAGSCRADLVVHGARRFAHFRLRTKIERHAADIALVRDVAREDF